MGSVRWCSIIFKMYVNCESVGQGRVYCLLGQRWDISFIKHQAVQFRLTKCQGWPHHYHLSCWGRPCRGSSWLASAASRSCPWTVPTRTCSPPGPAPSMYQVILVTLLQKAPNRAFSLLKVLSIDFTIHLRWRRRHYAKLNRCLNAKFRTSR